LIGVSLLRGNLKWRPFAIVRVVLGGLVFTGIAIAQQQFIVAAFPLVLSGAFLLLLIGTPSMARIITGSTVYGLCIILACIGFIAQATGTNLLAPALAKSYGLEEEPVRKVTGESVAYGLSLPNDRWRLRKSEMARKDNPLADAWLVRPDRDAHIIVIAEAIPEGSAVDVAKVAEIAQQNASAGAKGYRLVEKRPLGVGAPGVLLHARSNVQSQDVESLTGVFVDPAGIYQVIAVAPRAAFPQLKGELLQVIESFKPGE
jgi:hypothetical protein